MGSRTARLNCSTVSTVKRPWAASAHQGCNEFSVCAGSSNAARFSTSNIFPIERVALRWFSGFAESGSLAGINSSTARSYSWRIAYSLPSLSCAVLSGQWRALSIDGWRSPASLDRLAFSEEAQFMDRLRADAILLLIAFTFWRRVGRHTCCRESDHMSCDSWLIRRSFPRHLACSFLASSNSLTAARAERLYETHGYSFPWMVQPKNTLAVVSSSPTYLHPCIAKCA